MTHHHSYQMEFKSAVDEIFSDVIEHQNITDKNNIVTFFKRIIEPDRTIRFKVEWKDDQGKINVNRGYRVQFLNSIGPYKGGLRFHPTVNESILKFLSFEQIFKNALTDFPIGGAKGGADFDPKGRSVNEIQNFCMAFMNELYKYIGMFKDIPAGDIGVGSREIGFLYGQYLRLTDEFSGVLTGKDPHFGGSCGREEATGYGCVFFLEAALEHHNKDLSKQSVVISGAGNVALYTAEKLIDRGAKILAVSDSGGYLHFQEGMTSKNLDSLKNLKFKNNGRLNDFSASDVKFHEGEKPWGIECDIAIPCATQNEITQSDMNKLIENGVQVICEGANMPLTQEAVAIVVKEKIIYLPGKAANAGGVAVSNLEISQNSTRINSSLEEIEKTLCETMRTIHGNCLKNLDKCDGVYPYKVGANLYAFEKVYKATTSLFG